VVALAAEAEREGGPEGAEEDEDGGDDGTGAVEPEVEPGFELAELRPPGVINDGGRDEARAQQQDQQRGGDPDES